MSGNDLADKAACLGMCRHPQPKSLKQVAQERGTTAHAVTYATWAPVTTTELSIAVHTLCNTSVTLFLCLPLGQLGTQLVSGNDLADEANCLCMCKHPQPKSLNQVAQEQGTTAHAVSRATRAPVVTAEVSITVDTLCNTSITLFLRLPLGHLLPVLVSGLG